MLSYKAVLWDIDGTLLDSEPVHERAIIASAVSEDITVPHAFVESLVGVGLHGTYNRLCTDLGLQMSYTDWERFIEEFYVANAHQAKPREQVLETITMLHKMGIQQACVSNSPRVIVDANMKNLKDGLNGSGKALTFSLARDDVSKGKPSPEGYLRAASTLDVKPEECIAVEDSLSGIKAGLAAGMTVVAWPQIKDLDTSIATHTIQSLSDFFDMDSDADIILSRRSCLVGASAQETA